MEFLTRFALPLSLILTMFTVGLDLTVGDFRRVAATPKAVALGVLGQWPVLPLLATGLILLLGLPEPVAAGLILLAACPSGAMSNFLVYLARANAALSVTLTAVGSLLGVVVTPVLVAGGFAVLLGESAQVEVPVVRIILQLVLLTLLPLGIGMALRGRRESVAIALEPAACRTAGLVIAAILAAVVVLQWDAMLRLLPVVGSLAALFTLASMGAGWCLSRVGGLPPADRFAVLIEFSIRNVALAAVIGGTSLGRIDLVIVAAVYFVVEIPMAFVAVWGYRRIHASAP